MQAYGVTYPEAVGMLDEDVDILKQKLHESGVLEITGVGRLLLGTEGFYDFEPDESKEGVPSLYGLSAYGLPMVENKRHLEQEDVANHPKEKTSALPMDEIANYVAAAIVTLIFYFAWALPSYRDAKVEQKASVPYVESSETHVQEKVKMPSCGFEEETVTKKETSTQTVEGSKEKIELPKTKKEGPYTLVLATAIPRKNADLFIKKLADKGFAGAEVKIQNNLLYVVYGRFDSQMNAWYTLKDLHLQTDFHDAWIMKLSEKNL